MTCSIRQLARRVGVTDKAIRKARDEGRIPAELFATDATGRPYVVDPETAARITLCALHSESATRRGREKSDRALSGVEMNYGEARAVHEQYRAKIAELKFRQQAGELVDCKEVRAAVFRASRQLRDRLLDLPARLAPQLANYSAKEIEATLSREISTELTEFANSLQRGLD